MSQQITILDAFTPPDGMTGYSAALVAMTGEEDLLEAVVTRFSGLAPEQRRQYGRIFAYLMLDAHVTAERTAVLRPGQVAGLHEFHPRPMQDSVLLHAKLALLGFSASRTGPPSQLRLVVMTGNYTDASAKGQLELVWQVDLVPDGKDLADQADVAEAARFVDRLLKTRFYAGDTHLTARLNRLLRVATRVPPKTPAARRFIHSLDTPLFEQIDAAFKRQIKSPRNLLLCGSGFYERATLKRKPPEVLIRLGRLGVLTRGAKRVALVEPAQAGAVAAWAPDGRPPGWTLVTPIDRESKLRRLHAKFVYAGSLGNDCLSKGCLYLGSGNLSKRGLLTSGAMNAGNIECGVVIAVPERLDQEQAQRRLFWDCTFSRPPLELKPAAVEDAPGSLEVLAPPPILSANLHESKKGDSLAFLWRDDADPQAKTSIRLPGFAWQCLKHRQKSVPLGRSEPPSAIEVRDDDRREWTIPVIHLTGRAAWKPPRFDGFEEALAALLDFPLRPAEDSSEDDESADEGGGLCASGKAQEPQKSKNYALHEAAEFLECVGALQCVLDKTSLGDWLDHLDRMLKGFPKESIARWRDHGIEITAHLSRREFSPPKMTLKQRSRYRSILAEAARHWGQV